MLIGIVVTNAIVLLDLVERPARSGLSTTDALIEGGQDPRPADPHDAIATSPGPDTRSSRFNQGYSIDRRGARARRDIGGLLLVDVPDLDRGAVVYSLVDGGKTAIGGGADVATP